MRISWQAVLPVLAFATADAQVSPANADGAAPPHLSVSATGEAMAVPDRARISIGVQSRAATAAAAAAENARVQRAVLDTLRAMGFTAAQLTTQNYAVRPEMVRDRDSPSPRVEGYIVSNIVRVDIRELNRSGGVIDAAIAKGANQIHGVAPYHSNPEPLRRTALLDAVRNARADAQALAEAAGGTLGPLLELTTAGAARAGYEADFSMDRAMMGGPTPIVAGEQVVRAAVTARWAFIAGR